MMKRYLTPLVALLFASASQAQTCLSSVAETAPSTQFVDNKDGTVTDNKHGLMWMTCSVGQVWQTGNCSGDADKLNWQQALQAAHGLTFAKQTGWRVPNVKELATLTERACVRPSINAKTFPSTASDDYWTSTPSVSDPMRAWVVAFFNGSNSLKEKELFVFVRLVRTL